MDHHRFQKAPDYTIAFLWSALVVLFCALTTVWVVFGFLPALVTGWSLNRFMTWRAAR